ncbi:MAG: N-acetylglucosamine-6-phosphate deacetylase [Hespellia sp.]|nr:N-acetylglucosamine-6-phosphate deacetylase [Hespellia sp.]
MIIKNVLVYTEKKEFIQGCVRIVDGKFADPQKADANEKCMDGGGAYAVPGLIDIHFHGCVGDDMCDGSPDAIANIAAYEASIGVTSIAPATMTIAEEELHKVMSTAGQYEYRGGAKLVGINMEGPFISEAKKGAQAAEHIRRCDVSLFRSLQKDAKGLIKLVDIAPETEGAMEFIDMVKDEVVVSLAHTTADYDTAKEAYDRGARHATHLYNAMPPFTHRAPGVIGAARDCERCRAELICDGVHIHPSVVRATFEMFGEDRVILISDSMRAAGMPDGQYTLGGQDVFVKGNLAQLADGTIAGSATNLADCIRVAVKKMGIPLETAIACATMNPAKEIGIYDTCGSVTEGKAADLILLDSELVLKKVFISGEEYV